MSNIKRTRALRQFRPVTANRIGDSIPEHLWQSLTSSQLAMVAKLVEATYLDGFTAAGGEAADTVTHCDQYRQLLLERANA